MKLSTTTSNNIGIDSIDEYDFGKTLRKLRKNTLIEPLPGGDYWIVSIPRLAYKGNRLGYASYEIVDVYDPNTDPKYCGNKKNLLEENDQNAFL